MIKGSQRKVCNRTKNQLFALLFLWYPVVSYVFHILSFVLWDMYSPQNIYGIMWFPVLFHILHHVEHTIMKMCSRLHENTIFKNMCSRAGENTILNIQS